MNTLNVVDNLGNKYNVGHQKKNITVAIWYWCQ